MRIKKIRNFILIFRLRTKKKLFQNLKKIKIFEIQNNFYVLIRIVFYDFVIRQIDN